jgi:hypothetical protein
MNKYNTDYLSIMPDDDVFGALNAVRGKINHITRTKNANTDLDALQVEYCYLIRETDLRKVRKEKHEEYLSALHRR